MGTSSKEEDANKDNDTVEKQTKKKIIPVQSDSSDSSSSPEEPSTPVDSPQPLSLSSQFRFSKINGFNQQEEEGRNKSLGQKLKHSYSMCP